ncbi:CST complex subunit STN1 [Geranomyces michiganensis]|nr:CST complex subunit STN1 [Geranomyces michiganensis]
MTEIGAHGVHDRPPSTDLKENGALLGLDPLFWTCCKLAIADILSLRLHPSIPDVYLLRSHPVRKVELTGIVVAKEESSSLINYSVSDGTGTMPCVYWFPSEERFVFARKTLPLGQLVSVSGRISEFRSNRQVTVDCIIAESDPNVETVRWLEMAELMDTVYCQPLQHMDSDIKRSLEGWLEVHEGTCDGFADAKKGEALSEYERLSRKTAADRPTEEDLSRLVKLHIDAYNLERFSFSILQNAAGIDQMIRSIFASQNGDETPSKQRCASMLSRAMKSLVKIGLVYHIGGDEDIYEIISHELNLGPAIFELIKQKCQNGPDAVSEGYIIHEIRNMSQFKTVSKAIIDRSIAMLIASSNIYECGTKQYKTL